MKSKKTQTEREVYHVLGLKNQYCENDYITQSNPQIRHNPYQINDSFHWTRTKKCTISMETQKTLKSQAIWRKKNEAGATNLPDFRLYHKATLIKTVCLLLLFSHSVVSNSLQPHGLTAVCQASPVLHHLRVCSNSCPWTRWCHPIISSSVPSFLPPALNLFQH